MLRVKQYTRRWVCLFGVLSCLLLLVGCGNSSAVRSVPTIPISQASIPTLAITALDYAYNMPNTINIPAGLVNIALVNNGSEAHQAQVARLNTGVTSDEVHAELVTKKDLGAAFSLLTFVGGPDTVAPGYGQEAILNLPAAQYVLLCFVVSPDGVTHVDKGMLHFFSITRPQGQQNQPQADGEITMKDFSYDLPTVLTHAGPLTLQIINQGAEAHEVNIVKLAQGKSARDIVSFFQAPSGPPPFEEMGGLAALQAGGSAWIKLRLEPGNYAAFSYILDLKSGKSQLALGMIAPFSVQA